MLQTLLDTLLDYGRDYFLATQKKVNGHYEIIIMRKNDTFLITEADTLEKAIRDAASRWLVATEEQSNRNKLKAMLK